MLLDYLKKSREKIDLELRDPKNRKKLSPIIYAQYKKTIPIAQKYAYGNLLDAGCGFMPYKELIKNKTTNYDGYDIKGGNDVKFIGNITDMNEIQNNTYDTILCFEVLEHTNNPFSAIIEFNRVLKKSGMVIASVPHLSRLHEEPNDFYRYTKYGLEYIFQKNGFMIIQIVKKAGFFSFIGHQLSSLIVPFFWSIPIIKKIFLWLNYILITLPCFWIDTLIDKNGIFAQGYIIVAKKV